MEELHLSQINIPITLKISEIETTINKLIDRVLAENVNLADKSEKGLEIRAEKPENISLAFDCSHINYRIPLKLWIKKSMPITLLELEVEGAIALSLTTEFKIGTDWKLTTHTNIVKHEWLQKPQIRVGLFDLPIKFILNTILDKGKHLICTTLDKELAKNFDLQHIVKEAWDSIQAPILVAEEFGVWLNIKPVKVGMTPLMSDGDILKTSVMVQTYASAKIGEKPKVEEEDPLPEFHLKVDIGDDFNLHLKTEIEYVEAVKIAKKYIVGKSFKQGIFFMKIEDLKLFGKGEKMVIETKLSGTFDGDLIFEGKPVFNKEENEIRIEEIDYQLITKNLFFKFFNWFFHGLIKWKLKKHLLFPLTENLNLLMEKAGQILVDFEAVDNVFLNGKLQKIELEDMKVMEQSLGLITNVAGKITVFANIVANEKTSEN